MNLEEIHEKLQVIIEALDLELVSKRYLGVKYYRNRIKLLEEELRQYKAENKGMLEMLRDENIKRISSDDLATFANPKRLK